MQKKWKLSALLMIAAVGTLFGACKHHVGGFYSSEERMAHLMDKLEKELDLDAAQKEEVGRIVREVKVKLSDMAQEREGRHQELIALVRKDNLTREELSGILARHQEKMQVLSDFAGQQFVRFHSLLTPAQREKLAVWIETKAETYHRFH